MDIDDAYLVYCILVHFIPWLFPAHLMQCAVKINCVLAVFNFGADVDQGHVI